MDHAAPGRRIAGQIEHCPQLGALVAALGRDPGDEPAQTIALAGLCVRHHLEAAVWRLGLPASADLTPRTLCSRFRKATGAAVPEHLRRFADDLEHASRGVAAPLSNPAVGDPVACATLVGELRALILDVLRAGPAS